MIGTEIAIPGDLFRSLDVSTRTIAHYEKCLEGFLGWARGYQGELPGIYLEYKRHLSAGPLSVSTRNTYLTVARLALRELYRRGLIERDITIGVKAFRQTATHKKDGLTVDEVTRVLEDVKTNHGRLKALIYLLAFQGLRTVEIVRLDIEDLQLEEHTAMIHGKGRDDKERIRLHSKTARGLAEYLEGRGLDTGPLFVSEGTRNHGRITERGIFHIVSKFLCSLGISKSSHGFRHFFTTHLVRKYNGDLLAVSRYTRHKGLGMLQVYWDDCNATADIGRFEEAFNDLP